MAPQGCPQPSVFQTPWERGWGPSTPKGVHAGQLPCIGFWERPDGRGVYIPTIEADITVSSLCKESVVLSSIFPGNADTKVQWAEVFAVLPWAW